MPHAHSTSEAPPWTTRRLIAWITTALTERGIDSPRLCAEMLVAHALGCERLQLYMEADRPASAAERRALRELTARAIEHEPVQYLVGESWFYSLPFCVDRRALIPRPSSEKLVEIVLHHAKAAPGFERAHVADICTGSGCIAVAILKNLPEARAEGVDISPEALRLAEANAQRHGVADRLTLCEGDLLAPLMGSDFQYLVANPPYIPDHEWADVPPNVKGYEPELALRGGADGLDFVRRIIESAPALLRAGGLLVVEIASSSSASTLALARSRTDLTDARIERDHEGLDRVLVATKAGTGATTGAGAASA